MSTLFSKPDAPAPLPVPTADNSAEVAEAARNERRRAAGARGRGSTILTKGDADMTSYGKTLLGA